MTLSMTTFLTGCSSSSAEQDSPSDKASTAAETQSAPTKQTTYPLTITMHDGDGTTVEQTYNKAPERVITLIDSAAEIMCRLGLADKVVGTSTPSSPMPADIADEYNKIPNIGEKSTISRETIVGLNPDLIIGPIRSFSADKQTDVATFNNLGSQAYIQIATSNLGEPTLQGIIDDVNNIAAIFNVQDKAAPFIKNIEDRLSVLKKKVSEQKIDKQQRVFIMTRFTDGTFSTFTGKGGATLQFNLIKMMGATPAIAASAGNLTYENLIELNPDVIVYVSNILSNSTGENVLDTLYKEPSIQSVPAVANKKIVELPYAEFMDTTPRIFDSAEKLFNSLYPAA